MRDSQDCRLHGDALLRFRVLQVKEDEIKVTKEICVIKDSV